MTHMGQGGMVDDRWQSAPGKIGAPPTLRWGSGGGGGSAAIFLVYMVVAILKTDPKIQMKYIQRNIKNYKPPLRAGG